LRTNADRDAIHGRDAVASSYPNTLAFSELRAAVRPPDPSQNVRVDIGRRGWTRNSALNLASLYWGDGGRHAYV
jgi:hypothetical protein